MNENIDSQKEVIKKDRSVEALSNYYTIINNYWIEELLNKDLVTSHIFTDSVLYSTHYLDQNDFSKDGYRIEKSPYRYNDLRNDNETYPSGISEDDGFYFPIIDKEFSYDPCQTFTVAIYHFKENDTDVSLLRKMLQDLDTQIITLKNPKQYLNTEIESSFCSFALGFSGVVITKDELLDDSDPVNFISISSERKYIKHSLFNDFSNSTHGLIHLVIQEKY